MTPEQATQQLLQAAQAGDVSAVQAALDAGAEVNAKDRYQWTPLHWAAREGHTDLARVLIEHEAEVNARDEWQRTPLHCAAANGHTNLARLLVEKGADLNAKDKWQQTQLHCAAIKGHTDLARLLIDKAADPTAKNDWHQTPLHCAAANGHTDLARLLVEKGADLNAKDEWQQTQLHCAAGNGHTEVADLLATAERWHGYVKPLLGADQKLDATQLVNQAGQPTQALKHLLANDLFGQLARPDFYRQGMDGLVLVFPYLPQAVQASIDLAPWRRAKAVEANSASGPVEGFKRYVRPRRAPPSDVNR